MILYLDFNGVLHHENVRNFGKGPVMIESGHSLFEWSNRLNIALLPYPEVQIVLSTSWVRILGFS